MKSYRGRIDNLGKKLTSERKHVFGTGYAYDAEGDVLYGVDEGLTEAQVRERYPWPEYHVHLLNVHVCDRDGKEAVDENGRAQLVDTRGL